MIYTPYNFYKKWENYPKRADTIVFSIVCYILYCFGIMFACIDSITKLYFFNFVCCLVLFSAIPFVFNLFYLYKENNKLTLQTLIKAFLISMAEGAYGVVFILVQLIYMLFVKSDAVVLYDPSKKQKEAEQTVEKLREEIEELTKLKQEYAEYENLGRKSQKKNAK